MILETLNNPHSSYLDKNTQRFDKFQSCDRSMPESMSPHPQRPRIDMVSSRRTHPPKAAKQPRNSI
ncbi:MAG: hypothetical protein JRE58_04685 [Deltaproteobacteria bacterium]|nr:hypothetical protein [Deltaproteobacteria bacterium]